MDVTNDLIKLGTDNPDLRPHIRPILASLSIVAEPRYRDYVRRHKGPGSPMKKEDWEAKVLGKPSGKKPADKAKAEDKKPADDKPKADKKPKITKKWHPKVKEVMEKHDLTDAYADEVKAFKSDKPSSGAKLSPQQLMQKFLQKAKPETRERMKGVSPGEFMKMLGAIMDEEGGAKMASLQQDLIKLGVTNPELRPHIRQLLAGCEKLPEGGMRDNCEKKKEEGGDGKTADFGGMSYVNKMSPSLMPMLNRVDDALGGNPLLAFGFVVRLLNLVGATEEAKFVDRYLARNRIHQVLPEDQV